PFAPFATPSLVNVDACSTWSSAECNICLISLCISCTNPYRNSTTSFYRCHEMTGFSQVEIDHSTTEGSNAPCILSRSSEHIDSLPKTLNSLGIDGGAITRVSVERKREMRGRSVGREGEILRWSYAGNGVRHLTGGWRECIVRKVDGKAGTRYRTEQEIPGEKLQAVLNQFTRKALRVVQERNVAARCRRWRSIRPVWLEGRDMGRGLVQLRGKGDHDTTSLRILADILGYRFEYLRERCSRGEVGGTHPIVARMGTNSTKKSWRESEKEDGIYTKKKLDEMMVVCESFLEHLRVQSQVLVNLHFLTSPLDGELNRACGRDSKEISFLHETRHSSPSLPSTTFRLLYLPGESHASSKCLSSVRHYYWPSKFRPRGDQAQEHVSTTDPRIKGPRFKGRSLKCDCWSSVTVSSANNQGKSSCSRSLLISHSL
ncbi:hypothetical protein ALC53_03758, partial [Atta colombica]